jgi:apolipoprotein N-acyltransferase
VNTSTVGTSAIITPDGATLAQLETFEPGAMVESVPLSDTITPAAVVGRWVELLISLGGLLALGAAIIVVRWRNVRIRRG